MLRLNIWEHSKNIITDVYILKKKRRLIHLKTQFVPRSKHF